MNLDEYKKCVLCLNPDDQEVFNFIQKEVDAHIITLALESSLNYKDLLSVLMKLVCLGLITATWRGANDSVLNAASFTLSEDALKFCNTIEVKE